MATVLARGTFLVNNRTLAHGQRVLTTQYRLPTALQPMRWNHAERKLIPYRELDAWLGLRNIYCSRSIGLFCEGGDRNEVSYVHFVSTAKVRV